MLVDSRIPTRQLGSSPGEIEALAVPLYIGDCIVGTAVALMNAAPVAS